MKTAAQKLFSYQNPYDHKGSSKLFLQAVQRSLMFHQEHCKSYRTLLAAEKITAESIRGEASLHLIPAIPTVYYKHHTMFSTDKKKMKIRAFSSGTSGSRSFVGFDAETCHLAGMMLVRFFSWHRLVSFLPANYLILGIAPEKGQQIGAYKTLQGAMKLAPAAHVEYVGSLTDKQLLQVLKRYEREKLPVRILGFPAFLDMLLDMIDRNGSHFNLSKRSKILIGGGYKTQKAAVHDEKQRNKRIHTSLGISRSQCNEFFSAVEHPIPYWKCQAGHFHVPIYSRVIVRDSKTLKPVDFGQPGLLNLITPLVQSMPLISVVTDDFAAAYPGGTCKCGNPAPYFKWLGRAGVDDIRTCAAHVTSRSGGGS